MAPRKKTYDKSCATCGAAFVAKSHNAKYCPECNARDHFRTEATKEKAKNARTRVSTRVNTRVRLGKGMSLSLNFPLFKLKF